LKTGQIREYPNLNEILDPAVVNALYEGGTNRRKVQFQDFELVVKQNTEIRNQIGDTVLQARLKKNLAVKD
jgi:hypothetical protein